MLDRIRPQLSFANVMSVIAVFLALGGGAYAVARIDSGDIRNSSIRGRDVRNNTLRGVDISEGTLRGVDRCPSSAPSRVGDVCFGSVFSGTTWTGAVQTCRNLGLRLPSIAEAFLLYQRAGAGRTWTDEITAGAGERAVVQKNAQGAVGVDTAPGTASITYICVTTPAT